MENTHKRWKIVLLVVALYLVAIAAAAILVDARHVKFVIQGEQTVTVPVGESFTDPGRYAVSAGRLFGERGELPVTTSGSVDTHRVGVYELTYSTRYLGRDFSVVRTVNVVDREPPVITLQSVEGYTPSWFTGYEEEGFSAWDNCDGDLTARVQRTEDNGIITYTVADAAGNSATVTRRLPAVSAPEIVLTGGEVLTVDASLSFSDPGFSVVDGLGNDLSDHVTVEGWVAPYTPGEYVLTYTIENGLGESVVKERRVTVQPIRCPDTVDPTAKTIYLTFDDGPGPYTDQLLDVLDKYNAKATFFVTAAYPKYYDCIGRAYREGHAIGVHTYSHNYYSIYASEGDYFADFSAMQDLIEEQTGTTTTLFRFPGGSSNTVSSFNPGIMTRLSQAMTALGYKYFDWNVTSGDAGETTKTDVVFENVVDGCSQRRVSVVLQHDIKDFSVDAVERILLWGLNNGYTFRALDMSSPDAHHGLNN